MHSILAARTDFSVGESILGIEALVKSATQMGAKAAAMTDTMSITGMIDFSNRCKEAQIKPIIGTRLRISDDHTWRPARGEKKKNMPRERFMTVYVLSEKGLKMLFRLLTLANSDQRFYYTPKLSLEDVYAELDQVTGDDVAVTLGSDDGIITHPRVDNIFAEIMHRIGKVYAELVPVDTPYFTRINMLSIEAIRNGGATPLVVRPALYDKGQSDAQEFMTAIAATRKISDPWHRSAYNRDFHLVHLGELVTEVKQAILRLADRQVIGSNEEFKTGLKNTQELVDRVNYTWSKAPVSLPEMAPDEFAAVVAECKAGWSQRFSKPVFGHQPTKEELNDIYMPRLKYELEVLRNLEFSGYFLLVQDVVRYSKNQEILVGPGRGSVGGSLVAYLMGITDCDPIRFGLLFERFINPDRIDLPDADLDFMSMRRHEVVEYLIKKYGDKRVAGVSNFSKLGSASVIRDVSRVAGLPEREYRCSKFVPKKHGVNVPLSECVEQVPEIADFASKHDAFWPIMLDLEGTTRNFSQHAAGIVVGGCDLVERAVIERRKESAVVNWDKRIVEEQGLVKMDILGLSTLDLISLTLDYIRKRHGKRVNLMAIPLDDEKVLKNFSDGKTTGIFQFESGGMRNLLKQLGKDGHITFEDITAATALYRPGPMESGMMESFYMRKQGLEPVEYDHPLMEDVLSETFGVIVYQEQVMKISQVIAGYTAPEADKLRKIMGKKLPEEMKKQKDKFVNGCVATINVTPEWAGALFDKIEGFAGYGFNKSHSVEYTLISYQSAWLKTYYPVEFFAAALTIMDTDKLPGLIKDAQRFGVEVDVPDVNNSTDRFEIVTDTRLVIPFQRVKGLSEKTTEAILEARAAGPFVNKEDFLKRIEKRRCNVKHQDILDRIGAFARIEPLQLGSKDPSRVKDQIELIPGLITANVPISREMANDSDAKEAINEIVTDYRTTHGPGGSEMDGMPVKPAFGKTADFMLIQDCPGNQEEKEGLMGFSMATQCVIAALGEVQLSRENVYWTALVKRIKTDKQITPEEINTYWPYLRREIDALKPPIIVLLGSGVVRHFVPDFVGKASDAAGSVIYSEKYDANLVIGFNPGELYFDPSKQEQMNAVFSSVADLLA